MKIFLKMLQLLLRNYGTLKKLNKMKKMTKAMYGKSMMKAGGMTSGKCPSGYTLVNGKCTDSKGNTLSAPYVSEKGAFYPDEKSLTSGCAKNPNGPGCKAIIDKMTPEQKSKIKGIQRLGGSTKKMKTGGMTNANKSVSALKAAGSKGVISGENAKVSASKVAKGRSGGTSKAPKTAVPKAMYGTSMRPGMMKKGGAKKMK